MTAELTNASKTSTKKMKILFVDDTESENRFKKLLEGLKNRDIPIDEDDSFYKENAKDSYAILTNNHIDVLISDINLSISGNYDGLEIAKFAKEKIKDCKTICYTSNDTVDMKRHIKYYQEEERCIDHFFHRKDNDDLFKPILDILVEISENHGNLYENNNVMGDHTNVCEEQDVSVIDKLYVLNAYSREDESPNKYDVNKVFDEIIKNPKTQRYIHGFLNDIINMPLKDTSLIMYSPKYYFTFEKCLEEEYNEEAKSKYFSYEESNSKINKINDIFIPENLGETFSAKELRDQEGGNWFIDCFNRKLVKFLEIKEIVKNENSQNQYNDFYLKYLKINNNNLPYYHIIDLEFAIQYWENVVINSKNIEKGIQILEKFNAKLGTPIIIEILYCKIAEKSIDINSTTTNVEVISLDSNKNEVIFIPFLSKKLRESGIGGDYNCFKYVKILLEDESEVIKILPISKNYYQRTISLL
jgi:hypothetical protein